MVRRNSVIFLPVGEALAMSEAMILARSLGAGSVTFESDSSVLMSALNDKRSLFFSKAKDISLDGVRDTRPMACIQTSKKPAFKAQLNNKITKPKDPNLFEPKRRIRWS